MVSPWGAAKSTTPVAFQSMLRDCSLRDASSAVGRDLFDGSRHSGMGYALSTHWQFT
jgi:hypothetical protein